MSLTPPVSFKVRTTLSAYRIVAHDTAGAGFVVYPSSAAVPCIGVTVNDVKDINEAIPVCLSGPQKVYFNDTMSSGALVASDSSGRAVPHVNVTAGSYVIGSLMGPAVTQTGTLAMVNVNPFFKSIP